MERDYVTILEKVAFKDGKAVSWERSWDDGQTWETVDWPRNELPFTCILYPYDGLVTEKRLMPRNSVLGPTEEGSQQR